MLVQQLQQMRRYFQSGATRSPASRKAQLKKLKQSILQHETALYDALYADLKKSREEVWVTETGIVIAEINTALKNIGAWMEPESVPTNLLNLPSSSRILKEPMGVVLIIGPWNYPFQLLFNPLIGALAAGNCVVLKPSEFAPATTSVMARIVADCFHPDHVFFTPGDGATVVPDMMNNFTFDHVFYTGSTGVGKLVYQMAAQNLVPVTLELGGKSPCVVEDSADIKVAARRIALTKFSNAGQMCVAPDYVLVHASKKEAFTNELKKCLLNFFGEDASTCENYGKLINEKQFNRVMGYLYNGDIVYGGRHDVERLYIEPTLLHNVQMQSPVMQEEIFGPVLPMIDFSTMEEALGIIDQHKNPLAFYLFTSSTRSEKEWMERVAFGGGCINNTSWHLTNHHLPFGGRGFSGMGQYHGKASFEIFSHKKSVMKTPTWFDPAIKYPPFKGKLKLFKWIIR